MDSGFLDRTVTPYFHRQRRDLDQCVQGVRAQQRQQFGDQLVVPCDQPALHLALTRVAERIKRCTSEESEPRQQSKHRFDPCPELPLEWPAARIPARGQDWRRQMVFYPEVAVEFVAQFFPKAGLGMEARHLILVLVSHQLEQRMGHRGREHTGAGEETTLGCTHFIDALEIAAGIVRVLIRLQEFRATRDHIIKRFRGRACSSKRRPEIRIGGREASAGKGLLVLIDRDAVEFDRAQQCL